MHLRSNHGLLAAILAAHISLSLHHCVTLGRALKHAVHILLRYFTGTWGCMVGKCVHDQADLCFSGLVPLMHCAEANNHIVTLLCNIT